MVSYNKTRVGAYAMVTKSTVQDCLDFCISISECVGVNIDYHRDPVWCWLHTDPNDYVNGTIYTKRGTHNYQLLTRCTPESINTTC